MTPAATSLVTEIAPPATRGRLTALLESFWVAGTLLAAAAAYFLIPLIGWRGAMGLGALTFGYVWVVRRLIPESPRFLVSRGFIADAFALRDRLAARWGVTVALPTAEAPMHLPLDFAGRLRELWSPAYRQRTIVLWSLWFVLVLIYRGVFTWLPTLLVVAGQTAHDARFSLLLITLAQLPGTLIAASLIDRVGRKPILVVGLGAASGAALLFGAVTETASVAILVGSAMSALFMGAYSAGLVYTPELYPTRARATGVGMASSFGRIAAIIAPPAVSSLLLWGGGSLLPIFAMFATALAGGAFVIGALGEETRGRGLEDISR
jgi:putative MFS transporter